MKSQPIAMARYSDDYIAEHAYLVERGVRPMAIVDHVSGGEQEFRDAWQRLAIIAINANAIPFVIVRGDGVADCGYAATQWVVDLHEWLMQTRVVPRDHQERILGLLLGYSPTAIRAFQERRGGDRAGVSPGVQRTSTSRPCRTRGKGGSRG